MACCARYPRGLLIFVFKSAGFTPTVKNPSLNDSKLLKIVLSGPAVPISEGLVLDPCKICTKFTHEKEKRKNVV